MATRDEFVKIVENGSKKEAVNFFYDNILKYEVAKLYINSVTIKACRELNKENYLYKFLQKKQNDGRYQTQEALAFLCLPNLSKARKFCYKAKQLREQQNKPAFARNDTLLKVTNIAKYKEDRSFEKAKVNSNKAVCIITEPAVDLRLLIDQLDKNLKVKLLAFDPDLKKQKIRQEAEFTNQTSVAHPTLNICGGVQSNPPIKITQNHAKQSKSTQKPI